MKKITQSIALLIATLLVSGSLIPVAAFAKDEDCPQPVKIASWDGCHGDPIVYTKGSITEANTNSAVVNASFTFNGADFNTSDAPQIYIEYGQDPTLYTKEVTDSITVLNQTIGSVGFSIKGIQHGKNYYYRAILVWVGGITKGDILPIEWKTATTTTTTTGSTTTTTTSPAIDGSTTKANTSDNYMLQPTAPSTGLFGIFGTKKATTATTTTSQFKNVDEKSGFKLAIDDGVTKVSQGDTVTLKVRYENNNAKLYKDGTINIYLPDQYIVDTTNKGIHDKVDNMVSINLKEFPAGGFGTAIVIAKATGRSGNLDQAVSQASLTVGTVTLKVTDIDEYGAGTDSSGNVLGASASGAGFLPGKLIGWILLLIVLAAIVIIGRRYFVKKDY